MSDNKELKIWKLGVLLLVLCNLGLMLTIWLKPHMPWEHRPESPRDFVIRSLSFSEEQVKKYDPLVKEHQHAMQELRKQSAGYHQSLFANLKSGNQAGRNPDSLTQLIANNQKQIELVTYHHFEQIKAICTDAQKITFDQIIDDLTKRMSGNNRNGHAPPHPGDRQGPPPPPDGNEHDGPPPPGDREHNEPPPGRPGPPEHK